MLLAPGKITPLCSHSAHTLQHIVALRENNLHVIMWTSSLKGQLNPLELLPPWSLSQHQRNHSLPTQRACPSVPIHVFIGCKWIKTWPIQIMHVFTWPSIKSTYREHALLLAWQICRHNWKCMLCNHMQQPNNGRYLCFGVYHVSAIFTNYNNIKLPITLQAIHNQCEDT